MLQRLRENKSAQGTLLALPTLFWMFALLIIPLLLTLVISFGKRSPDGDVIYGFSLDNYTRLLGYSTNCDNGATSCFNPLYLADPVALDFAGIQYYVLGDRAGVSTGVFHCARNPKRRNIFLFMVLIPLWTNFVIRVYAWMMLLRKEGAINIVLGSACRSLPHSVPAA